MKTNAMIPDGFNVPYNQEAEQALIGSVIINSSILDNVAYISPKDFFLLRHQYIWDAIKMLHTKQAPIDLLVLVDELNAMGKLDDIGGGAYLIESANNTPSSVNYRVYAQIIKRTAMLRGVAEFAENLKLAALSDDAILDVVITNAYDSLQELMKTRQVSKTETVSEVMDKHFDLMRERVKLHRINPDYLIGVGTGLTALDDSTGGIRRGAITTLAGATGMGKTATVMSIAMNASLNGINRETRRPAKVLMFCGEMTQEQMNDRLLAMKTSIPSRLIERGAINPDEMQRLARARQEFTNHALRFESVKRLTPLQIRDRVRTLCATDDLDLFVLDGLMQIDALQQEPDATKRQRVYQDGKRRDVLDMILNDLEDVALTHNVPILLTHQISRAANSRSDKRPKLSDLAEAVFVEQKSAVVWLLYRDEYYDPNTHDAGMIEVSIAKNRFGETGTVMARYDAQRTLVCNV